MNLEQQVQQIYDHVKVMNSEMGEFRDFIKVVNERLAQNDVAHTKFETNQAWLMKIGVAIIFTIISASIAIILNI